MRRIAAALASAALLTTASAEAFVVPRWNAQPGRGALVGSWRAVSARKQQDTDRQPQVYVAFDPAVVWIESASNPSRNTRNAWRIVSHDGDLLSLELVDAKRHVQHVDALVSGGNALTLYFINDDGDDDEVLRLERLQ
jgi:hypothetical protein